MRLLPLTFVILLPIVADGQPYWWQPSTFYLEAGKPCILNWVEGENFIPRSLPFNRVQLASVEWLDSQGQQNILPDWKDGDKAQLRVTPLTNSGGVVIAQTRPVFRETAAEIFNSFLKEYGQDEIYFRRETGGKLLTSGKESVSQYIKLLLQGNGQAEGIYNKTLGLPLEIIPVRDPGQMKVGEVMRFKILFEGKPLFGARVKVWNRKDSLTTLQNIYTEKDGIIETRVSNSGSWMISVVQLTQLVGEQAEYRSYWCSLIFNITYL